MGGYELEQGWLARQRAARRPIDQTAREQWEADTFSPEAVIAPRNWGMAPAIDDPEIATPDALRPTRLTPAWPGHNVEERLRLCAESLFIYGLLPEPDRTRILGDIDAHVANGHWRDSLADPENA